MYKNPCYFRSDTSDGPLKQASLCLCLYQALHALSDTSGKSDHFFLIS